MCRSVGRAQCIVNLVLSIFRSHFKSVKASDLAAPINFAIACGEMETAKVLLWHNCCKSRSTVLWSKLCLPTVDFLWIKDWYVPTEKDDFYARLDRLDLRDNKLTSVASAIFQLPLLNTLLLDKNELTELPDVSYWTRSLVTLSVSNNKLTSLPRTLASSKIRNLKIQLNRFSELPLCICDLVDLDSLDIRGNPDITALPEEMGKLSNLKNLQFDRKKVRLMPKRSIVAFSYVIILCIL